MPPPKGLFIVYCLKNFFYFLPSVISRPLVRCLWGKANGKFEM